MKRKIVRVGASLCILLPKEVIDAMNWDFGDHIDLILDEEEDEVIFKNLVPKKKKEKSALEEFGNFSEKYAEALKEIDEL